MLRTRDASSPGRIWATLGGFRHAEPVTPRDPRPAVNGRGYITTPAKPGLSRQPASPIYGALLRSPAALALGGFRHAEPVTPRDPRPAVNGRGYVTTPAKPGLSRQPASPIYGASLRSPASRCCAPAMRSTLGGFRHAEPVTPRDPRPAVNGRGYITTPAKPGLLVTQQAPLMGRRYVAQRQGAAHPRCEQPWAALGGFRIRTDIALSSITQVQAFHSTIHRYVLRITHRIRE